MRWRRWLKRVPEIVFIAAAVGALAFECSVPNTAKLETDNPSSTAFIDLRRDQAVAAGKKWKLQWQWKRLGQISRYLRVAVVYSEDINFYSHDGVDWGAMWKAFNTDLAGGQVGGSTITQQLAKNLYLSPNRSLLRKARELLIAFSLEDHLTKLRILELYLNVVEWGDGVFGAEAASQRWFGHSAQNLTPLEAVRLAIALPNPYTRAPNVRTSELTTKAARLIGEMATTGVIDGAQERDAFAELGVLAAPPEDDEAKPVKPAPKPEEHRAEPEPKPPETRPEPKPDDPGSESEPRPEPERERRHEPSEPVTHPSE